MANQAVSVHEIELQTCQVLHSSEVHEIELQTCQVLHSSEGPLEHAQQLQADRALVLVLRGQPEACPVIRLATLPPLVLRIPKRLSTGAVLKLVPLHRVQLLSKTSCCTCKSSQIALMTLPALLDTCDARCFWSKRRRTCIARCGSAHLGLKPREVWAALHDLDVPHRGRSERPRCLHSLATRAVLRALQDCCALASRHTALDFGIALPQGLLSLPGSNAAAWACLRPPLDYVL